LTNLTFGSHFDKKVELPLTLTHLTFGRCFNQKVKLPHNLKHLTFGDIFNQKILLNENQTYLTFGYDLNLTNLTFGYHFNQVVELPCSLTHLTFGICFNQPVELPHKLKYLKLSMSNLYLIENLPSTIEELVFGYHFHSELNNLPNSVSVIRFYKSSCYNHELNNLVDSIEILELPEKYQKKINYIPKGLKKIKLSRDYKYIDDFKDYDVETY
jgi:hypothetical protein